jgi:protein-S-isoprenylcysteine O-methyltransferase Ste14
MKPRHFIDAHKLATPLVILLMITLYGQWDNYTAWAYLAMHGTYCLLWVLKSRLFPDSHWERRLSLGRCLFIWLILSLYWVAPWCITAGHVEAPPWLLALCISLYSLGIFLHYSSDMQKYTSLQLRPTELITEGLWSKVRNPNYTGELLIYLSFSIMPLHWLPPLLLAGVIIFVWLPQMVRKDRSLSRFSNFKEYKAHTKRLFPFLF